MMKRLQSIPAFPQPFLAETDHREKLSRNRLPDHAGFTGLLGLFGAALNTTGIFGIRGGMKRM